MTAEFRKYFNVTSSYLISFQYVVFIITGKQILDTTCHTHFVATAYSNDSKLLHLIPHVLPHTTNII